MAMNSSTFLELITLLFLTRAIFFDTSLPSLASLNVITSSFKATVDASFLFSTCAISCCSWAIISRWVLMIVSFILLLIKLFKSLSSLTRRFFKSLVHMVAIVLMLDTVLTFSVTLINSVVIIFKF